jgi:hypothetical protein
MMRSQSSHPRNSGHAGRIGSGREARALTRLARVRIRWLSKFL